MNLFPRSSFLASLSLVVLTVIPVAAQPAAEAAPAPARAPFAFAALGCVPYQRAGGTPEAFARLIVEINRHDPVFSVHLGDIMGSDERSTDEFLRRRRDDFNTFSTALVYTPGDNEWTDTHAEKAGGYDPVERLAKVRAVFFDGKRSLGRQPIPLTTQQSDPKFSKFVENARWAHAGVVFATVHVVGSHNNRQPKVRGAVDEWRERDAADEAWVRATFAEARSSAARGVAFFFQANPFEEDKGRPGYDEGFARFLKAMEDEARAFGKPVLLVHADEHRYRLTIGMRFQAGSPLLPNVTRLETFGGANIHAVLVTVDPESEQVFSCGPLIIPGNPLPVLNRPKAAP